jgi:alpha-D-glucose phosphate-specific phosphoglucomutase
VIKFGTGGWREIIGERFIKDNIRLICQGLSGYCDDKKIVIGYDRRFLSDLAARWCCEVFAANGVKTYLIDRYAPTPLTMFCVKTMGTRHGVCITASHNPAVYNGIKVFTAGGRDATEDITEKIERAVNSNPEVKSMPYDEAVKAGLVEVIEPYNDYIDAILKFVDVDAIRRKRLKVLIDPMHGVSRTALQAVLISARCDVDIINDRNDASFGGMLPSPAERTLTQLIRMVSEGGFDLGIATDGDADRIGIIDETGRFIHPNEIMAMLYYYMLKYKGWKGAVVRNIATTHLLDKIAADFGQDAYEVPVGFKHISQKMDETGALIGGESSGGLTIRGHISGKDGIFASALLVEMMAVTGKKLSELLDEINGKYGRFYLVERDYKFSEAKKAALFEVMFTQKKIPDFGVEVDRVSYADGMKIFFKDGGWIIARFSGTEPLLRIFCETSEDRAGKGITKTLEDFLGL